MLSSEMKVTYKPKVPGGYIHNQQQRGSLTCGGKACRGAVNGMQGVASVLIQSDIINLHLGRQIFAIFHAIGKGALAVWIGAIIAMPTGRAMFVIAGFGHTPLM